MLPFIAHTRERDDEEQSLLAHLSGTADRAQKNAGTWGGDFARLCGLWHDVGKYSEVFQRHIRGDRRRVDHATAGGQLLKERIGNGLGYLAAYCVMGHHGGLPNGGSPTQAKAEESTLYGRLKREVEDYAAYEREQRFSLPDMPMPPGEDGFDLAFFVRMAYSALVDADWLDTDAFCRGESAPRDDFASLEALCERLSAKTESFLRPQGPISDLNRRRNELLTHCLSAAEGPGGLFSLTAPTGSGKTIASLAFALRHAVRQGKRRVIYVVPYNTIIGQNAKVFEDELGVENVLRHNSDVSYDGDDRVSVNKRHSIENWDYPLIVTSSVQFFESLFANKPSKCRKLHNIADSVLVFDEAQMIPIPYLIPCVRAIRALVEHYGCTAVLATATQSSLDRFFAPMPIVEIAENPVEMYDALRRATIRQIEGQLTDAALAEQLAGHKQVLCVVNTRRAAQNLCTALQKWEGEGTFHLSTTMVPAHRKRVLEAIRARLRAGETCRVVSTSLVEAGVDLDFETVYRERAGLDSVVQAAGRCNREGKRKTEDSVVYVFSSADHKPPPMIQANIDVFTQIARKYEDLADLDAIGDYFRQLHYQYGDERLDEKKIVALLNDGAKASLSLPFADVAKQFRLIDDSFAHTVYVLHEAPELEERVRAGERGREIFRELGAYGVSLYDQDLRKLQELKAIERLDESIMLLPKLYYDEQFGVTLTPEGGQGYIA